MSTDKTFYTLFRSIHDVLKAEKRLKETAIAFELVPVPRQISSECGVCIKSAELLKEVLSASGAPDADRCYMYEEGNYFRIDPETC